MTTYTDKPWLKLYTVEETELKPEFDTALEMFYATRDRNPDAPLIRYFDGTLTADDVDRAADALANTLVTEGFSPGDRLALFTQNNPAYIIGLIAAWKAGGAGVAINPMNREREVTYLLEDSGAIALLALDELYDDVARSVVDGGNTAVRIVVTTSARDWQTRNDERLFSGEPEHVDRPTIDLYSTVQAFDGDPLPAPSIGAEDPAILTYTSGTTGKPKGAISSHRNIVFNSQTYRDWIGIGGDDVILGIAPLFHVTGLVAHIGLTLLTGAPLVLAHRFHPGVVLDTIRETKPTFAMGAVTAFTAMVGAEGASKEDFASIRTVYSGGAAIAPALGDRLEEALGSYVHNAYGLTETTSPTHFVPRGVRAPVDPDSGALSIGVPVFSTVVRVLDDDGNEVPVGQVGEIASSGPQIVSGYWNKPEETAAAISPDGEFKTGDVGFMDADGWFYLVDRKKDMINASGYKVWPREVEDVLYGHPAVGEVAVVGVPDDYRGEAVKAYIALKKGATATADEIIDFAKTQMAAYKYPRLIEFIEEVPKNAAGKMLRRELRDRNS